MLVLLVLQMLLVLLPSDDEEVEEEYNRKLCNLGYVSVTVDDDEENDEKSLDEILSVVSNT
jgi:hypothetical protein